MWWRREKKCQRMSGRWSTAGLRRRSHPITHKKTCCFLLESCVYCSFVHLGCPHFIFCATSSTTTSPPPPQLLPSPVPMSILGPINSPAQNDGHLFLSPLPLVNCSVFPFLFYKKNYKSLNLQKSSNNNSLRICNQYIF